MATQIRNEENRQIDFLVQKLTILLNGATNTEQANPVIKRRSNVFELHYNVSVHQPHLPLITGCKSRSEFISRLKDCINTIVLFQSLWLESPSNIVGDYYGNRI